MSRNLLWSFAVWLFAWALPCRASDEADAAADLVRVPPDARPYVRYLSMGAVPEKRRDVFRRVLSFHVNSLSTGADLIAPVAVTLTLMRLDLRDYCWKREVWEKLANLDPYHHVKVREVEYELVERSEILTWRGGDYTDPHTGKLYRNMEAGRYDWKWTEKVAKKAGGKGQATASAPWLDPVAMLALTEGTHSEAPLLRADWFFVQTARQLDRNNRATGAGYYDFVGIKSRKDILEIVGLDEANSRKFQRQLAAVIQESGVAVNNRAILAQTRLWETYDVDSSVGDKNALRNLNGDFFGAAQASEVYFTLPNDLFGFAAVNVQDGTLQNVVPPQFASDSRSSDNDHQVHVGPISCARCHTAGLQPIKDWARDFYKGDVQLVSPDYDKFRRLRALYLRPLEDRFEADQLVYARALHRLTGMAPAELAKALADEWRLYADEQVSGGQFALELGVTEAQMKTAFAAAAKTQGVLDPVIVGYLKIPEFKARRAHVEEVYVLAATYVRGFILP